MEGLDFERGQTGWVFMWKVRRVHFCQYLSFLYIVEFLTKVNIVNHVGRFFASLILRPHLNAEYALKAVVLVCSC